MNRFSEYLDQVGEVGYVSQVVHSVVYIEGLPSLHIGELVLFENGAEGTCFSLGENIAEIVLLSSEQVSVGERVARTAYYLHIGLGEYLLGSMIDPMGRVLAGNAPEKIEREEILDRNPPPVLSRRVVDRAFTTGVKIVDIVVPLGKGQRELVIGDRKTGKTQFLFQILLNQAREGAICVYAGIGKRQQDVSSVLDFIRAQKIADSLVVVVSGASDVPGRVFMTPYTAMTVAEYFRDKGRDVVVILDDMTAHAKYYREINLETKRFPGRSSYPGDIFYVHARLMERAGNFENGSITCIPVAETVLGDISGFIQTNLMSMTDGHIYFDVDRFNLGQRPPVNPFLSVTRVGLQAQSPLVREVSRHISSFLVQLEEMRELMHFGAEVSKEMTQTLSLGNILMRLFDQRPEEVVPVGIIVFLIASIWAGLGKEMKLEDVDQIFSDSIGIYQRDPTFKKKVDGLLLGSPSFVELVKKIKLEENFALPIR